MVMTNENYKAFLNNHALIVISSIAVLSISYAYYKKYYKKKKEISLKRDPVNFNLFVKTNSITNFKKENKNEEEILMSEDMISIPILYGTEFGFSKEIAEKLCNQIKMKYKKYWYDKLKFNNKT